MSLQQFNKTTKNNEKMLRACVESTKAGAFLKVPLRQCPFLKRLSTPRKEIQALHQSSLVSFLQSDRLDAEPRTFWVDSSKLLLCNYVTSLIVFYNLI